MNNASAKKNQKTPLQIQKEKVASLRKAIERAEALEALAEAEAELEEAEAAELAEAEVELEEAELEQEPAEDEFPEQEDFSEVEENYADDDKELDEPPVAVIKTKKPRPSARTLNTSTRKTKIRTRTQERELEALGLPPHVSSWEISDSPENEDSQIITFFAEGEAVTYIDINPDNLEDMMTALNSAILITGDNEVTGWSLRVPENPDIPPLLSLTSNGGILATLPLDEAALKQLLPKLESYYQPDKITVASFKKWATKHKIVSSFLGLALISMFLYAGYTALF